HADTEACFVLLKTSDFAFVHQVLTFTRVRRGRRATSAYIETNLGGYLHTLVAHGPDFLSHEEFQGCLSRHLSTYYESLGVNLILGRDKTFWDYHRRKLTEAGFGFSRVRVARGALSILCRALLNPKNSIEKLMKRRDDSRPPNQKQGGATLLADLES
ncbi:MAG: hypothetical protein ACRD10_11400, partial [Terriglobia bacterium]